jgi:predicted small metal-binding protein
MTKVLKCRDLGQDCDWEARAHNPVELLAKAAEHARKDHHMTAIPPDLMAKAKAAIKDEERPA